jgi:hypothetical protein
MAMGHFTEDALTKFNAMCAVGVDFGEDPVYDFARCIKKDGEIYGISPGEVCKEGKQISDARAEKENKGQGISRMAKLRAAFIKKIGREMTSKELEKARNMISRLGSAGKEKNAVNRISKKKSTK